VSDFLDLARLERGLAPPLRLTAWTPPPVGDAVEVLRAPGRHTNSRSIAQRCRRSYADPDASIAS
jgi:hypothetical protein